MEGERDRRRIERATANKIFLFFLIPLFNDNSTVHFSVISPDLTSSLHHLIELALDV